MSIVSPALYAPQRLVASVIRPASSPHVLLRRLGIGEGTGGPIDLPRIRTGRCRRGNPRLNDEPASRPSPVTVDARGTGPWPPRHVCGSTRWSGRSATSPPSSWASARDRVSPGDRIVEDLHCDSLDLVELVHGGRGGVRRHPPRRLPEPRLQGGVHPPAVPPRRPRRAGLSRSKATGAPERKEWRRPKEPPPSPPSVPFTQLDGRWERSGDGSSSASSSRWRHAGRCPSTAGGPTACGAC